MLDPEDAREALRGLFQRRVVADLAVLFRTLHTDSRMSVFRRLRELAYLTSFTHGGGYYTIQEIPKFDHNGLWFFKNIGFSRSGTLKETLVRLVDGSPAGLSYSELRKITSVRVENSLVLLVRQGRLERRRVDQRSVYVAADPEHQSKQIVERQVRSQMSHLIEPPLKLVVEILLEVVRFGDVYVPPKTLLARLVARGQIVSLTQVEKVFAKYGLTMGKKTDAAHPSSSSDT